MGRASCGCGAVGGGLRDAACRIGGWVGVTVSGCAVAACGAAGLDLDGGVGDAASVAEA